MAGERSYDELAELTGFDASKLNSTLTEMEFSGIIKQSAGRLYGL
jgi:predicted transcriptional regulator